MGEFTSTSEQARLQKGRPGGWRSVTVGALMNGREYGSRRARGGVLLGFELPLKVQVDAPTPPLNARRGFFCDTF